MKIYRVVDEYFKDLDTALVRAIEYAKKSVKEIYECYKNRAEYSGTNNPFILGSENLKLKQENDRIYVIFSYRVKDDDKHYGYRKRKIICIKIFDVTVDQTNTFFKDLARIQLTES